MLTGLCGILFPNKRESAFGQSAHVRVDRIHHFRCVCAVPLHGRQDVHYRKRSPRLCDWLLRHGERPRAGEETQEETSLFCVKKFR